MLAEYAIIPEVFSADSYASPEASRQYLSVLKDGLRSRGLVRNLHSGAWLRFVEENRSRWDMTRIKELLKLIKRDRLCDSLACAEHEPNTASEWCQEALQSHESRPLQGIIADQVTAELYQETSLVASSAKLEETPWWLGGKNSIELKRATADYMRALGPTLRHSKSLMFIDPHLDPTRTDYRDFVELLKACGKREPAPTIEIHRLCYTDPKDKRLQPELEKTFKDSLTAVARDTDLRIEVFLWDHFHDRYLISNLIGILIPNGFDTEANPSITRWARLDREHRDSVEKEFAPNTPSHVLRHAFKI